eukprot:Stramenopile-MAST_4_protein_5313
METRHSSGNNQTISELEFTGTTMSNAAERRALRAAARSRDLDGTGDLRRFERFVKKDVPAYWRKKYESMLLYETQWLHRFQVRMLHWPWTNWLMSRVCSKQVSNDLSVVTIVMGPVTAYYMGQAQLWRFILPCASAYLLELYFDKQVKRPNDTSKHFVPLCIRFGPAFPQVEILVAASCFYPFAMEAMYTFVNHPIAGWEYLWLAVAALTYTWTLSFSRIWAMVNFPHQVICSNVLGFAIAVATYRTHDHIRRHYYLTLGKSYAPVITALILFALILCARIENNDIKYLSVPKSEYMRVLESITAEDHAAGGVDSAGVSEPAGRSTRRHYRRQNDARKKDGFVMLMEQMERRSEKRYTSRLTEEEESRIAGF